MELEGAVLTLRLEGGRLLEGVDLGLSVLPSSISLSGMSVPSCLDNRPCGLVGGAGLGESVSTLTSSASFRFLADGSPVSDP